MSHSLLRAACALAVVPLLAFAGPKGPDVSATAEKIVSEVAGVKEKEVVVISGNPADQALLEALVVAVAKKGASPLLRLGWPSLQKLWLQQVPEAQDGVSLALEEKLLPLVDVIITVERADDPAALKDVPPARMAALEKVFVGFDEKRMKRKTRQVWLGNGLSPSKANAKQLGLSETELGTLFWAGVNTDYKALAARAEAVKAAVPSGKEIAVTSPAGTALKLKLQAKPMGVSDGAITAEEAKQGGPAILTWLPAGEVYGLVEAGSAEGKVVVPKFVFEGEQIDNLALTIAAGKVTALEAKPSKAFDRLKGLYDAAPAGKELLSLLDFGVNADVKAPKGKQLRSFVPAGAVTVFVGQDVWAGGTNGTSFGLPLFLTDATVTVDGKPVVEKGELKVAAK